MKINKISVLAVSLATLLALSTTVFAGDSTQALNGFYTGLGIGFDTVTPPAGISFDAMLDITTFFDDFTGSYLPTLGYRFNQNWAIESQFNYIANDSNTGDDWLGPDNYRLWSLSFAGKYIFPIEGSGLAPYLKAGFAITHQDAYNQMLVNQTPEIDSNTTRLQPLVGFGTLYNFNKHWAMDLGFSRQFQNGITPRIDVVSFGLNYTF